MSIVTHRKRAGRLRCEEVTPDTIHSSPCVHQPPAAIAPTQSGMGNGAVRAAPVALDGPADDPAVLIGLALAFVRQNPSLSGDVPEPLMTRLTELGRYGNPACRLLIDWLEHRNRGLAPAPVTASGSVHINDTERRSCRSPRERVLEALADPGRPAAPRRIRMRPRGRQPEIIAAETGGRADG